jgi:hypothetical protein
MSTEDEFFKKGFAIYAESQPASRPWLKWLGFSRRSRKIALIKCSDCGREISTRAAACPHCGCPNDQEQFISPATASVSDNSAKSVSIELPNTSQSQADGVRPAFNTSNDRPTDNNAFANSTKTNEKYSAGAGCAIMLGAVALAWSLGSGVILIVGLIVGFVVVGSGIDIEKLAREKHEAELRKSKLKSDNDAQILCPQCQVKGKVITTRTKKRKGISGGRAIAMIVTGGLSLPAAGISRFDEVTEASCSNCGSKWEF